MALLTSACEGGSGTGVLVGVAVGVGVTVGVAVGVEVGTGVGVGGGGALHSLPADNKGKGLTSAWVAWGNVVRTPLE